MNTSDYLNNILGAFATTLSNAVEEGIGDVKLRSQNAAAALVTIHNHPDETIDVLRRVLNLTHSGAVRLIDGLEEDDFVERAKNAEDRRSVVLRLTKKGQACAEEILSIRARQIDHVTRALSPEQIEALGPILEAMLGALTNDQMSARRNCRLCRENSCRPEGCPVEVAAHAN